MSVLSAAIIPDPDGGYVSQNPETGTTSQGETIDEALSNLKRSNRILKLSTAPVIEKRGNEIVILYTSGVNTICVATYSIESGIPEFLGIETIAWNDSGVYRKSESFEKYEDLLNKRGV